MCSVHGDKRPPEHRPPTRVYPRRPDLSTISTTQRWLSAVASATSTVHQERQGCLVQLTGAIGGARSIHHEHAGQSVLQQNSHERGHGSHSTALATGHARNESNLPLRCIHRVLKCGVHAFAKLLQGLPRRPPPPPTLRLCTQALHGRVPAPQCAFVIASPNRAATKVSLTSSSSRTYRISGFGVRAIAGVATFTAPLARWTALLPAPNLCASTSQL